MKHYNYSLDEIIFHMKEKKIDKLLKERNLDNNNSN